MGSLGASWPYLGALCCYLVASWPQRLTKGGPREPKRGPRGAQVRPRGSQKCSGELRRGPREPLTVPREPKTGRESSKESPRQRLNHVCKEGGLGGSLPSALYKQGQDNLALSRASLFVVLFASVFAILHVFAVPCLLLRRAVCCALHCLAVLRCTDLRCTSYGSLRCSCFAASLNYLLLSFVKYTYVCYIYIYVLVAVLFNSF